MRRLVRAITIGATLALAAVPAASAATTQQTSVGTVAVATWLACGDAGCVDTTASLGIGTTTLPDGTTMDSNQLCITRQPSPLPVGVSTRIIGCVSGVGSIAPDLSTASASGEVQIFSQDCDDQGVCFPGSEEFLETAQVTAVWTATGAAAPLHSVTRSIVDRITGEHCRYISVQIGTSRDATVVLTGWPEELGELTSAWIGQVTTRLTRHCQPG